MYPSNHFLNCNVMSENYLTLLNVICMFKETNQRSLNSKYEYILVLLHYDH